jgi:hypothetical protein
MLSVHLCDPFILYQISGLGCEYNLLPVAVNLVIVQRRYDELIHFYVTETCDCLSVSNTCLCAKERHRNLPDL